MDIQTSRKPSNFRLTWNSCETLEFLLCETWKMSIIISDSYLTLLIAHCTVDFNWTLLNWDELICSNVVKTIRNIISVSETRKITCKLTISQCLSHRININLNATISQVVNYYHKQKQQEKKNYILNMLID